MAETAARRGQGLQSLRASGAGRVVLNWLRELTLVPVIVLLMVFGWVANPILVALAIARVISTQRA